MIRVENEVEVIMPPIQIQNPALQLSYQTPSFQKICRTPPTIIGLERTTLILRQELH